MKNQFVIKKIPSCRSQPEAFSEVYVDKKFNDPSIIKYTAHVDFNNKNINHVRFVEVEGLAHFRELLTCKLYVNNAIDDPTLVKNNKLIDFNINSLFTNSYITLNFEPSDDNYAKTKTYIDSCTENDRERRDSYNLLNCQDDDFDKNKLTKLDSITVNRNPTSDNELANKKVINDNIGNWTLVTFNRKMAKYIKVSFGESVYNFTKFNRKKTTDITVFKLGNDGGHLKQAWSLKR